MMNTPHIITDEQLEKENIEIARRYREMLQNTYVTLSDEDKKLIRRAFDLAVDAHKDQRRKTGEPYIYHPIAVAKIVADEIGLGATSIASALMHDVVEDTDYTVEDIEKLFGAKIAKIIDGLTKISVLNRQDLSIQSENYKKLLLTLSEDVRVILIKIADRLHNMRTLESMREDKQLKIASETIFIYAPLAHRMGLYNIKSELEDLSLKYTQPEAYFNIEQKLTEAKAQREDYIQKFCEVISDKLEGEGLEFEIKGRSKSINSIYRKTVNQGIPFEEVFDLFAIRVIYRSDRKNEKFLAWKIYSLITDLYIPNPKRMRDWISQPKTTGYESLHVTVMGPQARWVEVQIRSERMDEVAEMGIAAHYKYKENVADDDDTKVDEWIHQVREMLENEDTKDAVEFMDNFKLNLYSKEIYVFTPKGDLHSLPKGASSLDFAYSIHSNVGDHCLGAKVNGKLYPLSHKLQSGDQVEIITSTQQKPKLEWLDYVVTSKARSKVKASLNSDKRKVAEEGKEIIQRKLRHLKVDFSESTVNQLQQYFKLNSSQDLFYNVAMGIIDNNDLRKFAERNSGFTGLINRFRKSSFNPTKKEDVPVDKTKLDSLVFGNDEERLDYELASCCNPIAGDKVFGFITVSKGIKVHKVDCPNSVSLQANYAYRIIKAKWIDSSQREFKALIELHGLDRAGIVSDITLVISKNNSLNMHSINLSEDAGIFDGKITVSVKNKAELEKVMLELKNIESIQSVKRTYKN